MVKHEIKIEFSEEKKLSDLINKAYFIDGDSGKITKKKHFISITSKNDIDYSILKGMNGATIKINNDNLIDGSMRFMVEEVDNEIRLFPISIYAVKEGNLYSFY